VTDTKQEIEWLAPYVSDHKVRLIDQVLRNRTRRVTVVLEDIYFSQNASAALRTCECLGVQDVHIIEDQHTYKQNPKVLRGAGKWLSIHRYPVSDPAQSCIRTLKSEGFTIYSTSPAANALDLYDIVPDHKMAFVFGTELTGISAHVQGLSDHQVKIPMVGFTDSFNISVSVALTLQHVMQHMKGSGEQWQMSLDEQDMLRLHWYRQIVKSADRIIQRMRE